MPPRTQRRQPRCRGGDGALYLETDTSYTASSGYGYDADGNVLGYHVTTTSNLGQTARTDSYQNTYVLQNQCLVNDDL